MPVPEIYAQSSVLGFRQWAPFRFQPWASNDPTAWQCSPLPPGVTFDPVTGTIQGPATMPGVYNFELRASNASGVSAAKLFALGIEASGFVQPSNVLETYIDVTTRHVSLSPKPSEAPAPAADAKKKTFAPLFWMKAGDVVIFAIRFVKGEVPADLNLTDLKFILKEYEPEPGVATGGGVGQFQKVGTGVDAVYRLAVTLDGDALKAVLSSYEADESTEFKALGEFEWKENNPTTPRIGPEIIRGSSRTFGVTLARDLIANT